MPDLLSLASDQLRVDLVPELGGSIASCQFQHQGQWLPILRQTKPEWLADKNVSLTSSFILAPYSNRIANAQFSFDGQTYTLRPTHDGHTLHGEVRQRPWLVANVGDNRATLMFDSRDVADLNFPFPFAVLARYTVAENTLESMLTLTNTGPTPMPAGFGFHPYFNRHLTAPDGVTLQANFTHFYRDLVPTKGPDPLPAEWGFATAKPFPKAGLDHCFAGWDGQATIRWPQAGVRAQIACDPVFSHVVMYTPPGDFDFAFEPVTHANNGFNLLAAGVPDTGVRVLEPGQSLSGRWRLTVDAGN